MVGRNALTFAGLALVAGIAGLVGWYAGRTVQLADINNTPIREDGYHLANPLLVCARDETSKIDQSVQTAIQNAVGAEVAKGDIDTASVYYRRFFDNSWALVNGDATYYPASLNKVPLMIAYYNLAEEGRLLGESIYFPPGPDENQQQEIRPKNPIRPGQSYSTDDLVRAMIEDSDNNATLLLFQNIPISTLKGVFANLGVPVPSADASPVNYMNVSSYAFFFRVLYNATYLSHTDSERALNILAKTDFNDGLVAGVPRGTIVAHKFGLLSVAPDNNAVTGRELHDCGIVYPRGNNPYLICVMTKSSSSLERAEQAIAAVSRDVYQYATK